MSINPVVEVALKLDNYKYLFLGAGSRWARERIACWGLGYQNTHIPVDPVFLIRDDLFIVACRIHADIYKESGWIEYE